MQLKNIPAAEYDNYFALYVGKNNPEHDIHTALQASYDAMTDVLEGLTEEQLTTGYAPGKWSLKQSLQHLIDSERVFVYRALAFARGDKTTLPGFDQDEWVANDNANARDMEDILDEYDAVREATMQFYEGLSEEALSRSGTASTNTLSVRAIAFVIAGHDQHHVEIIKDRYI